MFRSIRLTVLFWYALLLLGALAIFGYVLHGEMERALYRVAEERIDSWLATIRHKMEEYGAEGLEDSLRASLPATAIFTVHDAEGTEIAASEAADAEAELRERTWTAPDGRHVRVATDVRVEHRRIRSFLNMIFATGLGILLLGLVGGWLLVSRALRPIDEMTAAAERISSDNLSERIGTAEIRSELGRLARTLNETFDRLEAAFEQQTRFTADASHELRTPLTILLTHLELAQENDRTLEASAERVEICLRAGRRMKAVIEGLLTLARVDAGEIDLEKGPVDLASLVEETGASLAPLAEGREVALTVDAGPATVTGDRERLRTVVTNLVTNAIRYNRASGRVEVTLRTGSGAAVLAVRDTGVGIARADLPHLFERFYRADKARSREMGGTGLGLAITRWTVEAHGGRIDVESEESQGTVFTVRLPLEG